MGSLEFSLVRALEHVTEMGRSIRLDTSCDGTTGDRFNGNREVRDGDGCKANLIKYGLLFFTGSPMLTVALNNAELDAGHGMKDLTRLEGGQCVINGDRIAVIDSEDIYVSPIIRR
jgi:hypothetical protein